MWKTLVFEIQQAEDKKLGSIQQQNQNEDLESDSSDENESDQINQNSFLNQSEASTDVASQRKSRVQFNIPVNQYQQNETQYGISSQNKGSQETQDNFMNNSLLSKQSSISNDKIQKQGNNNFNFKKKSITLKKQNESQIGNNSFKETQNNISNSSLQQKLQQQTQVGVIKRPVGKNSKIMRPQSPRILQYNNKIDKSESIVLKQKNSNETDNKFQLKNQDQNQSQKMNQEQSKNILGSISNKNLLKKSSDSVQKSYLYNRPGLNNLKKSLEQNDIVFAKKLKLQDQNQKQNQNSEVSNLIQNDPFNKTGFNFKKKTETNNNKIFQNQEDLYDEEGNKIQLRPQTNQVSQRRGAAKKQLEQENNDKSQKIFKVQLGLENLEMAFSSSQQFTQIQKNTQEFLRMIEFWILEMKKLDRILDIQAIQTDNLIEEAKVWGDNIKIYEKFEQELNDEYTKMAIKILGEKAQFDQDVKKKYYQFIKYKEKIGKNKKEIKEFAKEIEEDCLEDFQKLNSAYYTQYPNIYKPTLDKILALYNDYPEIFNFRIYFVLEKIYQLLIKKMKQCHVKFQMCTDLENSEFVNNLLQGFESYISQLERNN
ncbi:hypothetical protein PPERSA_07165 [Pseudocohnilembus persalinus]|uniref:Uncharacterized protein n=1 Tax=Pseudocohnilembus persalinus TaxID=266149 RepID=A0A0V0QY57_PSEPJ|nr:hypothetical protein PPERSA_07165 [Pseudocohnilembus persalinus]|eukprot:KRX07002.1 hypothetical protein PPERSA_07165 [Pseudocohnilembus persalinus]